MTPLIKDIVASSNINDPIEAYNGNNIREQSLNKSRNYTVADICPRRMFLCEALYGASNAFTYHQGTKLFIRVMGTVIFKSKTPIIFRKGEQENKYSTFILDDGTGIIDVFWKTRTIINNNNDKEKYCSEVEYPYNFVEGDIIDCIGLVEFVHDGITKYPHFKDISIPRRIERNNSRLDLIDRFIEQKPNSPHKNNVIKNKTLKIGDNYPNTSVLTSSSPLGQKVSCLFASVLSRVPDINSEALRFCEICSYDFNKERDKNIYLHPNERGVIMAGDMSSKEGISSRLSDRLYIFHLIKSSTSYTLSFDDLKLILGCQNTDELNTLCCLLKDMQNDFEIYQTRDGSYLPL